MVRCKGQDTVEEKPRLKGLLHGLFENTGSSQRFHKSTPAWEGEILFELAPA